MTLNYDFRQLKVSKKYVWSLREMTEEGEPLTNVIEHGISRMKHASDAVAVILKELKLAASEEKCRILVAVDCVHRFFQKPRTLFHPDGSWMEVDQMTHARAFKKLLYNDWVCFKLKSCMILI